MTSVITFPRRHRRPRPVAHHGSTGLYRSIAHRSRLRAALADVVAGLLFFIAMMVVIVLAYAAVAWFLL